MAGRYRLAVSAWGNAAGVGVAVTPRRPRWHAPSCSRWPPVSAACSGMTRGSGRSTRSFASRPWRLEANAREARNQRSRVEANERQLRRQLAGHQVFSAQQAVTAHDFERALRMLDAAEPAFHGPGTGEFPWSYLRQSIRERIEVWSGHRDEPNWMAAVTRWPHDCVRRSSWRSSTMGSIDRCLPAIGFGEG